eukprot:TRINITY_DN49481_c0_g1_i1.p1 TRINITY_DN49481_c0_g1~~TRINITY_DN49481_c0_g1_i1.p1  ORF type:complete len:396 (+),score=55.03 TRINITY_DN49481_c0_g1_i1:77-1189(+)
MALWMCLVACGLFAVIVALVTSKGVSTALILQNILYLLSLFLTWHWQVIHSILSRILPKRDRAPQRLSPPRWLSVSNGHLKGLDHLPPMPVAPFDEMSVAFAGCANLSMYMYGVAFALQRASQNSFRPVRWRTAGCSSGAFVGAQFAMDLDCAECMLETRRRFVAERERFAGCIGYYSRSIAGIVHHGIKVARDAGREPLKCLEHGSLSVSVTHFTPLPTHLEVVNFKSDENVVQTVLASCYIPIAYEWPIRLPGLGFCIDGCVCSFLPNATCVVSPYHVHMADICPAEEYPGTLVFNLLHGDDVLRLFEDGYLDCLAWVQAGAPSRSKERGGALGQQGASFMALLAQGWHVLKSIAGIAPPEPRGRKQQ